MIFLDLLPRVALIIVAAVSLFLVGMEKSSNPLLEKAIYQEQSLSTLNNLLQTEKHNVNEAQGSLCPLYWSLEESTGEAMVLLLQKKADPNILLAPIPCQFITLPRTILSYAVIRQKLQHAEILINYGANINNSHAAEIFADLFSCWNICQGWVFVCVDRCKMVALLLRKGANPYGHHAGRPTAFDILRYGFPKDWNEFDQPCCSVLGGAFERYDCCYKSLRMRCNLPKEIVLYILSLDDFGLDNCHSKCAKVVR